MFNPLILIKFYHMDYGCVMNNRIVLNLLKQRTLSPIKKVSPKRYPLLIEATAPKIDSSIISLPHFTLTHNIRAHHGIKSLDMVKNACSLQPYTDSLYLTVHFHLK